MDYSHCSSPPARLACGSGGWVASGPEQSLSCLHWSLVALFSSLGCWEGWCPGLGTLNIPVWETRNRCYLKNTLVLSLEINAVIGDLIKDNRKQGQAGLATLHYDLETLSHQR